MTGQRRANPNGPDLSPENSATIQEGPPTLPLGGPFSMCYIHTMMNRRHFLTALGTAASASALMAHLPAWALPFQGLAPRPAALTGPVIDLAIGHATFTGAGRPKTTPTINGTIPGPLLRLKEGEDIALNVTNRLHEDSSIHWHGILLPTDMDGVPGLSFDGIKPQQTFHYRFPVRQAGTYWYHSHSGLQEQQGVYGPLIIDPAQGHPIEADREHVIMLSDWTYEDPDRLFANLKRQPDYYNRQRRTMIDFFNDVEQHGLNAALADRAMWGQMMMDPTDIADVTAATYTYLMNGQSAAHNWTALFKPGEQVRLRIINGSAMTFFNFRIPGLEMTVVQADGQDVKPVTVDEFQIGVAETYDVIVTPKKDQAFTIMAESMDRSGYVRGTLAPHPGMIAPVPPLRDRPLASMADMGMDHGNMDHGKMETNTATSMDHSKMDHSRMDHSKMGHQMPMTDNAPMPVMAAMPEKQAHDHVVDFGVANVAENPRDRLDHPGQGLEGVAHRTLTYRQLSARTPFYDTRAPARDLEIHLTGNMDRYMWSFDGVSYQHVEGPIVFQHGERLRLILVNDTMMSHPIHLHGMWMELENGAHPRPRKHTINVKPGERVSALISADAPGKWAFHCHLLMHMKAGMMRAVAVA